MLKGKTALVTGSAKRLGKGIALALARNGADVVIHYNTSEQEAIDVVSEIKSLGKKSYAVRADLCDVSQANAAVHKIIEQSGAIDIVVNNVGGYFEKSFLDLKEGEWERAISSVLTPTYAVCQAVLPHMVERNEGFIINIADSVANQSGDVAKNILPYFIGKQGVVTLTKALSTEFYSKGVRVNCISPGHLGFSVAKPSLEEMPSGRYATIDDVTSVVLFLAQSDSSYITGQNIVVAGGWRL